MKYDPFARGPYPVGVRSCDWTDATRARTLPVEVWYPADEQFRGQDLDPATWDTFWPAWVAESAAGSDDVAHQAAVREATEARDDTQPRSLVLLVHGWAGFRCESSFLGTHLASHGYVVVSPDVPGSTYADVDAFLKSQSPRGVPENLRDHVRAIARDRKRDIPFLISTAVVTLHVEGLAVGVTGASFGGWSSIAAPGVDDRVTAIVPMCPAGGQGPTHDDEDDFFLAELDLDWHGDPAALILAADRDSHLPLYGQLELLRALPTTRKRMVVLGRADHNHFVDDIDTGQAWLKEFAERMAAIYPDGPGDWPLIARAINPIEHLVSGVRAQLAWRGLTTAHFDAFLRDSREGKAFVRRDTDQVLAEMGVTAYTIRLDAAVTADSAGAAQ